MAQTPGTETALDTIKLAGWYHQAALLRDDATRALAPAFTAVFDAWIAARAAVEVAEKTAMMPRVAVRFTETALETAIDALWRDAGKAGNEASLSSLFPQGKSAETRPRGAAQLERTKSALLPRLRALPASGPLASHVTSVTAALTTLEGDIQARKSAVEALSQASATEQIAREDLIAAFRSDVGAITTIYPRNAALRDRFFLEFREARGGGGEPSEPPPVAG